MGTIPPQIGESAPKRVNWPKPAIERCGANRIYTSKSDAPPKCYTSLEWCPPQNDLYSPKMSDSAPKSVMLTQKWIMLSKNEWCSPKRSDPPVAGWYCPKHITLPQNEGSSPKLKCFPPKALLPPDEQGFPQNKGSSSKIKWFFWSGAPKMIDLLKTMMLPKMFPPNEQFSPKMSNSPQNEWCCPKMMLSQTSNPPKNEWLSPKASDAPQSE